MTVELAYTPHLAEYRLSETHPLRPERFVLAVELMRAWGLLCDSSAPADASRPCAVVVEPVPIAEKDLLLAHDAAYIRAVETAGANPQAWGDAFGIGPGDTPAFPHMHEVSAEICGATARALDDVVGGVAERAFSVAGGLHHAHRDRAAGFCVYNDAAVAICRALEADHSLRVAYIDLDVHHGDGVQERFYDRPAVLTISVHESGRYLYPGTGRIVETGAGEGVGFAINLPLMPGAGDSSYALAFESVIAPAVATFSPDVIIAQFGADSHAADPLGHLTTTVAGQYAMARRVVALADQVCAGRIVALGGGGYESFSAVPRAWACVLTALLGVPAPNELPDEWRLLASEAAARAGASVQLSSATFDEPMAAETPAWDGDPVGETERAILRLRANHPLLRGHG